MAHEAFWRDLNRAVDDAEKRGVGLSIARFSFDGSDRRISLDAARLVGRLMRQVDFACREADNSIFAVFTETDLRAAHVVARRIASVLKNTMLAPDRKKRRHRRGGDAGDLEADRQRRFPDRAGRRRDCRRLNARARCMPYGLAGRFQRADICARLNAIESKVCRMADSPEAPRCRPYRRRVRCGLPVVLYRQAPARRRDRAHARRRRRHQLAALFPQSAGSRAKASTGRLIWKPNSARSSATA